MMDFQYSASSSSSSSSSSLSSSSTSTYSLSYIPFRTRQQQEEEHFRLLQQQQQQSPPETTPYSLTKSSSTASSTITEGTFVLLMLAIVVFFLIWTPVVVRKCRSWRTNSNNGDSGDGDGGQQQAHGTQSHGAELTTSRWNSGGNNDDDNNNNNNDDYSRMYMEAILASQLISARERMRIHQSSTNRHRNDRASSSSSLCNQREYIAKALVATTKRVVIEDISPSAVAETPNISSVLGEEDLEKKCYYYYYLRRTSRNNVSCCQQQQQEDPAADTTKIEGGPNGENDTSDHDCCCAICLNEYKDGEEICFSQNKMLCNHFFHKACIANWLIINNECPCCRNLFLLEKENPNDTNTPTTTPNGTEPDLVQGVTSTLSNGGSSNVPQQQLLLHHDHHPAATIMQPSSHGNDLLLQQAEEGTSINIQQTPHPHPHRRLSLENDSLPNDIVVVNDDAGNRTTPQLLSPVTIVARPRMTSTTATTATTTTASSTEATRTPTSRFLVLHWRQS